MLSSYEELEVKTLQLKEGNENLVLTRAVGKVNMEFSFNKFIEIKDFYCISHYARNFNFLSRLFHDNYFISFNNKLVVICKN